MIQGNVGMKTETKDMKWHTRLMGLIHNPREIFYLEWIGIVLFCTSHGMSR